MGGVWWAGALGAMPTPLLLFVSVLAFFHASEAALVLVLDRASYGPSSWLFSRPYGAAMALALVEYAAEYAVLGPRWKGWSSATVAGLVLVVAGEVVRKTGILTAGKAFTHAISTQRREGHRLVDTGIYGVVRHPGYLGWLVWSVGTQVLLANPVCTPVFALWSWRFFRDRIAYEERVLVSFFGKPYRDYCAKVPTFIPFIP